MDGLHYHDLNAFGPALLATGVPADFVQLAQGQVQWIDRKLGYFGKERFVMFYYEQRGEGVIWKDGRTYGFGCGAWMTFMDDVLPLIQRYLKTTGQSEFAEWPAMIIDRVNRVAYLADRDAADAFILRQQRMAS